MAGGTHLAFCMSSWRLNSQAMLAIGWISEMGISGKSTKITPLYTHRAPCYRGAAIYASSRQ